MSDLWSRVGLLVDRARSLSDLRAHRLHLLAAAQWERGGRPVPEELAWEVRLTSFVQLSVLGVLGQVRASTNSPVLVFKGPEAAARYPQPEWRPYGDVDILVPDAPSVHRDLLRAGFVGLGDEEFYTHLHHLQPLAWPGLPTFVEVHSRPAWPEWMPEPDLDAIFARAAPSATGIEGLMAPHPADHALLIAGHAWDYSPLGRALDLIDVTLLAEEAGRSEVSATARRFGVERMWEMTLAAADALLSLNGRGRPQPWAPWLFRLEEPTVLGQHLQVWLSPYAVLPVGVATRAFALNLVRDLLPAGGGDTWQNKLARSALAVRNAFIRKSHHERILGEDARRPPRRERY